MESLAQRASDFLFGDRSSPMHTEGTPEGTPKGASGQLDQRIALEILAFLKASEPDQSGTDTLHPTQRRGVSTASEQALRSSSSSGLSQHTINKVVLPTQSKSRNKESSHKSYAHSTYSRAVRDTHHQREVDVLKTQLRELQDKSAQRERYIVRMQEKYVEFTTSLNESHAALEASKRNVQTLQNQLTHEQARREEAEKLTGARRRELQEAQAYLETSDSMSAQEVVGLVKAVNLEIFQFAATASESASPSSNAHLPTTTALDELKTHIGVNLTAIIRCKSSSDSDPIFLFQMAIQVTLLKIASEWTHILGLPFQNHTGILAAYTSVRRSSPQSVSARWRALVYSRHKYEDLGQAFGRLHNHLISSTTTVMHALGYALSKEVLVSGVKPITEAIIRLDRAAGEAALSQNLTVAVVVPGATFDSRKMEDMDGSSDSSKAGMVACCIELGLHCTERGGSGEPVVDELLLKPKVLLESTFHDQQ
ncbi:hypothetical protein CYLTODRAFT_102542 [Cylindrobasidium torrendii FP15055 ss-10]|uniref:Uncharacterized protein n=1 Tax=Cylindrobasidium torrendii FP15055 ss-10 TaxID=1314674 RepID=A0A0D7B169_9AGAR|nr:hypothetical protein CYLTODRAFT_102542 [Cylindrobasidium torrendii FP15055 ss-10]